MKYSFYDINDLCKQPDKIELLLQQNEILRIELGNILKRVHAIEIMYFCKPKYKGGQ